DITPKKPFKTEKKHINKRKKHQGYSEEVKEESGLREQMINPCRQAGIHATIFVVVSLLTTVLFLSAVLPIRTPAHSTLPPNTLRSERNKKELYNRAMYI